MTTSFILLISRCLICNISYFQNVFLGYWNLYNSTADIRLMWLQYSLIHENFCTLFYVSGHVSQFTVYRNCGIEFCILLPVICINLSYVRIVPRNQFFQVYYILLTSLLVFILIIFWFWYWNQNSKFYLLKIIVLYKGNHNLVPFSKSPKCVTTFSANFKTKIK